MPCETVVADPRRAAFLARLWDALETGAPQLLEGAPSEAIIMSAEKLGQFLDDLFPPAS